MQFEESMNGAEHHPVTQRLAEIERIDRWLPEDLVAGLAQEALRRIAARAPGHTKAFPDPSPLDIEELCNALIAQDETDSRRIVLGAQSRGVSSEAIYLKYLAVAARTLGDWWLEDRATFVQVTMGTGRLFALMRELKASLVPVIEPQEMSIVFASVPGEDHTLGVRMAADLFREDGWDIALKIGLSHEELVADIEKSPRSIVGLSIGGRHSLDALSRLVVSLHVCCPHAILLAVGQNIDLIRPHLSLMGLDGIAGDIHEAKEQIATFWDRENGRRTGGRRRSPQD